MGPSFNQEELFRYVANYPVLCEKSKECRKMVRLVCDRLRGTVKSGKLTKNKADLLINRCLVSIERHGDEVWAIKAKEFMDNNKQFVWKDANPESIARYIGKMCRTRWQDDVVYEPPSEDIDWESLGIEVPHGS